MKQTLDHLDTPAVVVDLDVMERNIAAMAVYARNHKLALWPHTKTHKSPELAQMQMAAGAAGITVAKVGEAEVMADAGFRDILIHYPVVGTEKCERLAKLANQANISVALDSIESAKQIASAAKRYGATIGVLIELDVGLHRTGVLTATEAVKLGQQIMKLRGVKLVGLSYFPGHIKMRPSLQKPALQTVSDFLDDVLARFGKAGLPTDRVSGGSTPTARQSHLVRRLTEIRPGAYIFYDRNSILEGCATEADCALRIVTTVISTSVAGRAMTDAGSKTLFSDRATGGAPGFGLVVGHPDVEMIALNEEHGHLDVSKCKHRFRVGERLTVIPNHVCPCVNLHDTIYGHSRGVIEREWRVVARGRVR